MNMFNRYLQHRVVRAVTGKLWGLREPRGVPLWWSEALASVLRPEEWGRIYLEMRSESANCHLKGLEVKTPGGWRDEFLLWRWPGGQSEPGQSGKPGLVSHKGEFGFCPEDTWSHRGTLRTAVTWVFSGKAVWLQMEHGWERGKSGHGEMSEGADGAWAAESCGDGERWKCAFQR